MDISSMVQAVFAGCGGRPRRRRVPGNGRRARELRSDDRAPEGTERGSTGRDGELAVATTRRRCRGRTAVLGLDLERPPVEGRLHGSIAIGPVEPGAARLDPLERLGRRMPVWIHGADGHDCDARTDGVEEGIGR
jgi:hypothetical protein